MSRDSPPAAPALPLRLLLALLGGGAIALAFPAYDQWYAAWLGCGLIAAAGWAARPGAGFLTGLVAGLAYFLPTLSWSGVYVGALPWVALATLQALYVAAMLAVIGPLQRRLLDGGAAWAAYGIIPLGWVVGEWARGSTPFGGFPWARLAFSQADSPLRALAAVGGAPLLTAAVATMGVAGYAAIPALRHRSPRALIPLTLACGVALSPLAVPSPTSERETARIGLVQGNVPQPGLDFNAERRAVLDNHVRVTEDLMGRPDTGPLDLVVWPENAADIDPLRNADAAAAIARAQAATQAPLLIGAILNEPEPQVSNASLLYRPGVPEPERYLKRHPVPFAEYVPYRDFFRRFNDKVDLVRAGMAQGEKVGSFRMTTSSGVDWLALPSICFEVAYDALLREAVLLDPDQPSVLVVQTNNATFGFTAESEQQYAISRIRAIEHGRSVVHVSTVGVSGVIGPNGTSTPPSALFTAYAAAATVPLHSGTTLANRLGQTPEYAALLGLFLAWGSRWRRRRAHHNPVDPTVTPKELASA